uniref:NADH-ubiquinone oxidoreductase chain 4 n=1 Tax=Scaphidium quadrimaculatum TaxID=295644 RepID=A0A0S2M854_SCAQU|nr:NADH dehydrogenase subunit 4 [Scaphidium quadrimaculatum]ALO70882.1 NADH deshydrogenase subunit 4 [Scaphidium quadrimaculatum]
MMKFLFFLIFMIPLSLSGLYWFFLNLLMISFMIFFFNFSVNYMLNYISFFFGQDLMSYTMVSLSIWICFLMLLSSSKIYNMNNYSNLFVFMVLMLLIFLVLTFLSLNLMLFYLFFEMSLIPTLILIMGWGYQPERIQAGMYLLFYTMFASLPMMISIFFNYKNFSSLDFFLMNYLIDNFWMFIFMSMVFFMKMPMFLVHLWLPKAHVEAPVSGSMILAGIMLKLGGYGLMRLMLIFLSVGTSMNFIFVSISLLGGVIISLICIRQMDMKSLIAYSSVAHMGLVLAGIFTFSYWGMIGALVMMVAHGLCSSGMFILANISYERMSSRSLYLNKGLLTLMPSMTLCWFLFCSSNMAAPPSLNLLGEVMLINSLVSWSMISMIFLFLISFFSAVYSLYIYSFSQHGKIYLGLYSFSMGYIYEYLSLFLHWIPLNLLILKSEFFFLWL